MKSKIYTLINYFFVKIFKKRLIVDDDLELVFNSLSYLKYDNNFKKTDYSDFIKFVAQNYYKSQSQIFQDLWVLFELNLLSLENHKNYFVEFGAFNGVDLSNTYLLEQNLNWEGLLCEPIPTLHSEIQKFRRAKLDKRVVAGKSGETVDFLISESEEYSSIQSFSDNDRINKRLNSKIIKVETVSLNELLRQFGKEYITFLSIDTEGSEYEILKNYSWEVPILMICVEHNFGKNKDKLFSILQSQGYIQRFSNLSKFDSWWILGDDYYKKFLSKL